MRGIAASGALLAVALVIVSAPGGAETDEQDAAYWIGRMEAALLPQSSLRTDATVKTKTGLGLEETAVLRFTRIQGPRRLRTRVEIQEDGQPPRIEVVVFDGDALRRSVYHTDSRLPMSLPVSKGQRIGETEFTYEDLAFADFAPRKKGTVARRPGRDAETIEITAKEYQEYGKVVTLLDARTALPREVLFFSEAGRLYRTLRFSDLEKEGPYTLPTRAEVENLNTGRTSSLTLSNTVIGPPIGESEFGSVHIQKRLQVLDDEPQPEELL